MATARSPLPARPGPRHRAAPRPIPQRVARPPCDAPDLPLFPPHQDEQTDTPQNALDFKAHQRLRKRRGALSELDRGRETLDAFAAEWLEQHATTHLSGRS